MARKKRARSTAAIKAAVAQAPADAAPPLPPGLRLVVRQVNRVTLAQHFAFYGDDGLLRRWQEAAVVTDPDEIAMLLERKAPLKDVA